MGKPPAPSDYAILLCPLSRVDGGGYLAVVPDLAGCLADGDTPGAGVHQCARRHRQLDRDSDHHETTDPGPVAIAPRAFE